MSGAAAREKLLAIVEAMAPTIEPGTKFRRSDRRQPLEAYAGQVRLIELTPPDPQDAGIAGPSVQLWRDEGALRILYAKGATQDREAVDRMVGADLRQIINAYRTGSLWAPTVKHISVRTRVQRTDVNGEGGRPIGAVYAIPVTYMYVE